MPNVRVRVRQQRGGDPRCVRARRTVVYGPGGKAYGDPALVQMAAGHPYLREAATVDPPAGALDWVSRASGILGLLGLAAARGGIKDEDPYA